jgi:hypothetical protein
MYNKTILRKTTRALSIIKRSSPSKSTIPRMSSAWSNKMKMTHTKVIPKGKTRGE